MLCNYLSLISIRCGNASVVMFLIRWCDEEDQVGGRGASRFQVDLSVHVLIRKKVAKDRATLLVCKHEKMA